MSSSPDHGSGKKQVLWRRFAINHHYKVHICYSHILLIVDRGTIHARKSSRCLANDDLSVAKQCERENRIRNLDPVFHDPLTGRDRQLLSLSVATVVANVRNGITDPSDMLVAYGKKALKAHKETNCLTEVMISPAQAWAKDCVRQGPLAGMPVSLKDTVGVEGWDSCIGYSAWVNKPTHKDSALVKLLHDAGVFRCVNSIAKCYICAQVRFRLSRLASRSLYFPLNPRRIRSE
jgi:hypothetical protein